MIREFATIDVLYLISAARWTIALAAIAFVGGGLIVAGLGRLLLEVHQRSKPISRSRCGVMASKNDFA